MNNHDKGRFYDDAFFRPVFAKCHSLDVPIYLHPTIPGAGRGEGAGNYPQKVANGLNEYCWGWHSDTGVQILRLYASGLFDEYKGLKVIIGHMGEMLPFMLDRIVRFAGKMWPKYERDFRTVWRENVYVTTAGMFSLAPMTCLLKVSKIEHILYSVDYPFETNDEGKAFLDELAGSGLCSEEGMDKIAFKNAEELLGVKALALR